MPMTHFVGGTSLSIAPPATLENQQVLMALVYSGEWPFPVMKYFGVNPFVLRDRLIPICLDGVAGLYSRSHTNAVKVVGHLAAGMCTVVRRRLRNSICRS